MSESLLDRVEHLLNEEKWTRAALSNYSVNQFLELESILDEAEKEKQSLDVKRLCDERLADSKNSIVALYLSGMIAWQEQQLEDADLAALIGLFSDNRKWNIVEYLCKKMLSFGESKLALTYLARAYENQGMENEMFEALERLAKVDYEDAELALKLAEKHEAQGQEEEAVAYYKKAIYRFINRKQFAGVQEIWSKLLQYCPDSEDLFSSVILKTEKAMDEEKAMELQRELYPHYKAQGKWDLAIASLKRLLAANPKDNSARKELIECYRQKYKDHSRLEEVLTISNMGQNWRNAQEAIESFEKHISLDKGRFIFHRTWGIGRIKRMSEDQVVIDFAKKRDHSMGLEMAISSLISLTDDHIWVLKAKTPKEALRVKIKKDIPWALKTLAASFGGSTDMKKAKAELSPSILTPNEWSVWSAEARKVIKTNPSFGNDSQKSDIFTLRSSPASYEEKLSNRFKGEENFFKKLAIMEEFLTAADPNNEYYDDMFNYFASYLKAGQVTEQVVCSYLFVEKMAKNSPAAAAALTYSFKDLLGDINDVEALFDKIDSAEYKEDFLHHIKRNAQEWPQIYLKLLPYYPARYMVAELKKEQLESEIKNAFSVIMDRYRNYSEPFFWLARFLEDENAYELYGIKKERILIAMLNLMDISYRNISVKKDLPLNKRINRHVGQYLFRDGQFIDFLKEGDEETAVRLYSLAADIKDLDGALRASARETILAKFPNIKLSGGSQSAAKPENAVKTGRSGPVWVTEKSYKERAAQLKKIIEVEIPKNSAEIGEAIKKGDLKENAEYIFGKERQDQLQVEAGRLQKELDNSRIFDADNADPSSISFGVTVTLRLTGGKKKETYTILGPWESNPDKKTLSYLAPFAEALLGHKVGENIVFTINERTYKYTVEAIEKAKF